MKSAVILLSGGMDSGVLLGSVRPQHNQIHCLSFDYGSKHSSKELSMAEGLAKKYDAHFITIELPFINSLFSSSLLKSGADIPEGVYSSDNISTTIVPFRNGIMLSVAVGYAEDKGIDTVMIASHAGDHPIYPDCRKQFTDAMSQAATYGTNKGVQISAPFAMLDKRAIAAIGREIGFDFSLTWSCYKGLDLHCGKCPTCLERKTALEYDKGLDPTRYME